MRPTTRTLLLFVLGVPIALVPALVAPALWALWAGYLALLVLAVGADALLCLPTRRLEATISAPDSLYIGESCTLEVLLSTRGFRRRVRVEGLVDLEAQLEAQPPARIDIPAHGQATLGFPLAPRRRGTLSVRSVWLRWEGPFGLMRRQLERTPGPEIAVVPNMRAVHGMGLRFANARELLAGMKVERYVGDGSEFEALREYVKGMDPRAIDWKSSARHRKLLCQEFRAERNHQVVIALDTGHLMSEPIASGGPLPIPKLDHAIHAALLLGYVSLRTGDRVGLYGFDERVRAYVEPQGGMQTFARLQHLSAELDYTTSETNFTLGLAELSTRLHRRSLVVVLSDFVDTVTAELMLENLNRLARRHLVVFVTLRDPSLGELTGADPAALSDLYRAVVADDFIREREVVQKRVRRLGIHCIDAVPHQVSTQLVNRYLEIKRRELV